MIIKKKEKKTCQIVDFAVLVDHRLKMEKKKKRKIAGEFNASNKNIQPGYRIRI